VSKYLKDDKPAAPGTTWDCFIAALLPVFALVANCARKTLALGADNDGCVEAHFTLMSRECVTVRVRV
jgi:hypothetical protein